MGAKFPESKPKNYDATYGRVPAPAAPPPKRLSVPGGGVITAPDACRIGALEQRMEAVEKENAELRARVAELENKLVGTITPIGITASSPGSYIMASDIGAQIEAGSPGPDWQK